MRLLKEWMGMPIGEPRPHSLPPGRQRPRRALLARAAAASAAVAGLTVAPALARAARLRTAQPAITLLLEIDWEGLESVYTEVPQIMQAILRQFEETHPGTRVNAVAGGCSNGNALPQSAIPAEILAGAGPDVFSLCYDYPAFVDASLVMPLDGWLRRDNVPLDTWPSLTLASMTFGEHVYFLPAEEQPSVLAYNAALLDELGLRIPSPDWTYTEAADAWRAASGEVGGKRRYGLVAWAWWPNDVPTWTWLLNGFGGAPQNSTFTRATFSSPACIAAGDWAVGLGLANVTYNSDLYDTPAMFTSGQAAFIQSPSWAVPLAAQQLRGMDWAFLPFPTFPAGPSTINQGNAYAISSGTRYPEQAWELLKWLTVDPTYWRLEARVSLNTPAQTALWPEWVETVLAIAPDLADKGLQYYTDAQVQNFGRPGYPFRYNDPECETIVGNWSGKIFAKTVSVADGFAGLDAQVNALESTAQGLDAQITAGLSATRLQLAHAGSRPFQPPPRLGAGAPYTAAAGLVRKSAAGGYTVEGGGQGLSSYNDDGAFAAAASVAGHASFTCRVTAITVLSAPDLDPGAQVGLMVRGDLSDNAPMAALVISSGGGVTAQYRAVTLGDTNTNTLINPTGLMRPSGPRGRNDLVRPVWLRLTRSVGSWTPAASLDGVHWQTGPSMALEMAGAWVGLFVTSNESDFAKPGRIQAGFDHLAGFQPTTFVQLGGP